ncbi:permease prefix domain 1-containing protein [Deinococcus aestuarii]|uniref:permease prefix domain 1-containing protein n=1 Tax=Deinococcus aestuarii TaxID=2774531 RepID=UPI001C0CEC96|nr:permease prefix domain 1-containing protein [Deinococcus aestuarii]
MNDLDRYLTRATRGLPRAERHRVREELRSSLLERAAEHQVAGHSGEEALRLALHEFGDPRPLAAGMQRLYTLPRLTLALLLAGSVLVLGVPSLARPPAVPALRDPALQAPSCAQQNATPRAGLPGLWDRWVDGRWETSCRAPWTTDLTYLRLADFIAALARQGVQAWTVNESRLHLRFPGQSQDEVVDLGTVLHHRAGERYLHKYELLNVLIRDLHGPVRLEGILNPTLELGSVRLKLGTPSAPLYAADLYAVRTLGLLTPELAPAVPRGVPLDISISGATFDAAGWPQLQIRDGDQHFFAMVDNANCLLYGPGPACGGFLLRVRAAQAGQLSVVPFTDDRGGVLRTPRVVNSVEEFAAATQHRQPALLIWQLDTRELKQLRVIPVTPSRVSAVR